MEYITSDQRGIVKHAPLVKLFRKVILSAIALLFTLLPVLSMSIWAYNIYLSDPREAMALERIETTAPQPALFKEPLVTVTFDDSWESSYSQGASILEKYDIVTTQYILPGQFDDPQYLSKEQVLSLQKAGHDIQSHTVTHANLVQLDRDRLTSELSESKKSISALTKKPVEHFASPLSSYNQATISKTRQYYRTHRNTLASLNQPGQKDYNLKATFNYYDIYALTVRRTTTAAQIKQFLQGAKEKNGWAVLVYHEVDANSLSDYAVTPENFDSQMQAIARSGLKIATIDQVMDYYFKYYPPPILPRQN